MECTQQSKKLYEAENRLEAVGMELSWNICAIEIDPYEILMGIS